MQMVVFQKERPCIICDYIVAEAMLMSGISFLSKIDLVIENEAITRIGSNPNLDALLVGFAGMYCRNESLPLKATIPSSTEMFLVGL